MPRADIDRPKARDEYARYKWVLNEPGARRPVAECVARDEDTAQRMLDSAVVNWDLTRLRLVLVQSGCSGPNHWIRIDPDIAPIIVEFQ